MSVAPTPGPIAKLTATATPAAKAATAPFTATIASPTPAPPEALVESWLWRFNHYRAAAGLRLIHDDPRLSSGMAAHAHYLMVNFEGVIRANGSMGEAAYTESRTQPGYTKVRAAMASNSRLASGCGEMTAAAQIEEWMESPFDRFAMLDPEMTAAGLGFATDHGCWVAALRLPPPAEIVHRYPRAIEFPPAGTSASQQWQGTVLPDPLTACPGYQPPVGPPISLQLGYLVPVKLGAHTLTRDGQPVEHCIFDAASYVNPNPHEQEYGRWQLRRASAVVMIPREPLQTGGVYLISITAGDQIYTWNVRAEPDTASAK